jgi:hypothetical protein
MKKNCFRIILTTFAFSLLCENKVQAAVESLGEKASINIPNNWIVTSRTATELDVQSPSGYVNMYISFQPRSTYGTIRFSSYENLNVIAKQLLMSYELDSAVAWINEGYPLVKISSAPVFSGGETSKSDFYAARITRGVSYEYNAQTYDYIATHQLLDDGKNLYQVTTYIQSGTTNSEANDISNTLSSISSSNINNPNGDSDGDGVSNFDEIILYGTDPNSADIPQGTTYQGPTITSDLSTISVPVSQNIIPYAVSTNFKANAFKISGLPKGLVINAKSGVITGKPTQKGKYTVRMTASRKKNNVVTDTVMTSKSVIVY